MAVYKFQPTISVFENLGNPAGIFFFLSNALEVGVLHNNAVCVYHKGQPHIAHINLVGGGCGQLVVIRTAINDTHNLALVHNGHAYDGGHFLGGRAYQPYRTGLALHAVNKVGALRKIVANSATKLLRVALFAVHNNLAVRRNEPAGGNIAVDGGKIFKGVYGVEKKLIVAINGGIFCIRL